MRRTLLLVALLGLAPLVLLALPTLLAQSTLYGTGDDHLGDPPCFV